MITDVVLTRANDKIISYIEKYVTLVDAAKKEEVLDLFDTMHRLFPHWVIATCPVIHPDIHYISKNAPFVFGESTDYLLKNGRMNRYLSQVHEADQEDLYACMTYLHDYLETIPPEEHPLYRTVFHYRYRKPDGQYIYLHDEKATLNLRGSGNLYYGLFRDVTAEKAFTGVKIELFRQDQALHKIKEYKPSAERNPLSKREGELVTLIRQGLSIKEIAGYLKISPNTARNIKSKLFEKYNVSNSIELLNMTRV
jgi:DNA-binding CsgD family transcriptional regulator